MKSTGREAVINSFAHARYDLSVQHEIDVFSNRISICNPGSFANEFEPIDFYTRDIRSYLRNEVIAKTLYLCKDVETFGSVQTKRVIGKCCNGKNNTFNSLVFIGYPGYVKKYLEAGS